MKAINYRVPFVSNKSLKLGLFSDLHLDSPDSNIKTLKEHLEWCMNDGRWLLFGGDIFDLIVASDSKRFTPSRDDSNRDDQINAKIEKAVELFKPYADNIIFMAPGNHEEVIQKRHHVDVIKLLVEILNQYKSNKKIPLIQRGNYQNFIRFDFESSSHKSTAHYDLFQHHGGGGNAPVTKGMIDFNRLLTGVAADLLWIGHKHNSIIEYSSPVISIGSNNEVLMKNRQAIMTPSYLNGRTIDWNINYSERYYTNQALPGFGSLELTPKYENTKPILKSDISIKNSPVQIIGKLDPVMIRILQASKQKQI